MPAGSLITEDYMIQYHTLFPFYKPFLPQERVSKIINWMNEPIVKGNIHKSAGIMASKIPMLKFLRYCPICCHEDIKNYGEPYWHRSHQLFGVGICHKHNNIQLIDSQVEVSSTYNRQALITLFKQYKCNPVKLTRSTPSSFQIYLAKAIHWLLNNEVPILGPDKIFEKYKCELQINGLVLLSGQIQRQKFVDSFISFYGQDLLKNLNLDIKSNNSKNWLVRLVHKSKNTAHPLQHLLLMNFLGITPEEFINSQKIFLPFGDGPWSCLNPIAPHYLEKVIVEPPISNNIVGRFKCPSCGFTYERFVSNANDDEIKIKKIISYGPVWENKFKQLQKDNKTIQEIADIMMVNQHIIMAKLIKRSPPSSEQITAKEQTLLQRRRAWLAIMKKNPSKSRNRLQILFSGEYSWLRRNDKTWLMINMPPKGKYKEQRIDWGKRDEELAAQVSIAATLIKEANDKPIRVTVGTLGKKLRKSNLLTQQLNKLPKTQKTLMKVVETQDEFYVRKIRFLIQRIMNDGEVPKVKKILKIGNLPNICDKIVLEEIKKYITTI